MVKGAVSVAVDDGVGRLRLAQPERLNAWSPKPLDGLAAGLDRVEDSEARCLVLEATGEAVCAGDIEMMREWQDETFEEHAEALGDEIATVGPVALRLDTRLLTGTDETSLEEALDDEAGAMARVADTEGVAAFLQERDLGVRRPVTRPALSSVRGPRPDAPRPRRGTGRGRSSPLSERNTPRVE